MFVRASFFLQPSPLLTPRCAKNTVNPALETVFQLHQMITDDFLTYLTNGALELQAGVRRSCWQPELYFVGLGAAVILPGASLPFIKESLAYFLESVTYLYGRQALSDQGKAPSPDRTYRGEAQSSHPGGPAHKQRHKCALIFCVFSAGCEGWPIYYYYFWRPASKTCFVSAFCGVAGIALRCTLLLLDFGFTVQSKSS